MRKFLPLLLVLPQMINSTMLRVSSNARSQTDDWGEVTIIMDLPNSKYEEMHGWKTMFYYAMNSAGDLAYGYTADKQAGDNDHCFHGDFVVRAADLAILPDEHVYDLGGLDRTIVEVFAPYSILTHAKIDYALANNVHDTIDGTMFAIDAACEKCKHYHYIYYKKCPGTCGEFDCPRCSMKNE